MTTTTGHRPASAESACSPTARVTKSLLGYGVLAGPLYLAVVLVQGLSRAGYDLSRHDASLLANGALGWIQITNFLVTGAMTIAAAAGMRRALSAGTGATWVPRLVGTYGLGLVAAGVFRADPSLGFPPGTPPGRGDVSWHGMLHLVSASIGFACLIVACFVMARRFRAERRFGWARYSQLTGVLFTGGFLAVASGSTSRVVVLLFTAAVVLGWSWLAATSADLYRSVR